MLKCYDKTFTCFDDNGNIIKVKGIPRKVTIKEIFSLHMKRFVRKGCNFFALYIMDDKNNDNQHKIEDISILNYFKFIFLE